MFRWNDEGELPPLELIHASGKKITIHVSAQMSPEEYAIIQGSIARLRQSALDIGRNPLDAETIRQSEKTEREAYAACIARIEGYADEPVTGAAEIANIFKRLPIAEWQRVRTAILDTAQLTPAEGKA